MSLAIPKEFVEELKNCGITEAVIVDDLFEPPSLAVVTDLPGFWTVFKENRATHPELETIFSGVEDEDGVEDSHVEGCWEVLSNGKSVDILNPLFGDYPQRRSELKKLSQLLSEIFGTPTVELVPTATIPDGAKLVFLDYYLGDSAEAANAIAKTLAKRKHLRPYLVLISDSANLQQKSEGFRSDTGYIAGTFAHLEKERAINPAELAYSLASWGLGNSALRVIQPLFDAMIASVDEAAAAVKIAMASVTIQDYSFLQNLSLAGDGHPLGEYIVDLFGASLSFRFRDSQTIKEARAFADRTPFKKHLPLSMVPSHLIVELYREAVTEPLVEEKIVQHPWCSEKTISVIDETVQPTLPVSKANPLPAPAAKAITEQVEPPAGETVSPTNSEAKDQIAPLPQSPSLTEEQSCGNRPNELRSQQFTVAPNLPPAVPAELRMPEVPESGAATRPLESKVPQSVPATVSEAKDSAAPSSQAPPTNGELVCANEINALAPPQLSRAANLPLAAAAESKVLPFDENAIAWLSTGDIFAKDESEPLLMVLNAGCDLQFAPNSKRKPQPDRSILLIEGNVYQISNLQPPDEIARTEFFKLGSNLCRINWTDRVRTIKHIDFKRTMEQDGYEKRIARLSLPYVLHVQQAWLASLGRVGVPVAPPHSGSKDIEIYVAIEKVLTFKKRISHGATVFRVKQTAGYKSEFLLSRDTVTEVRRLLHEIMNALLQKPGEKPAKKAEALRMCLETFDFWRELQEKLKSVTNGMLLLQNGILKASFEDAIDPRAGIDTQILLRFAEPQAVSEP